MDQKEKAKQRGGSFLGLNFGTLTRNKKPKHDSRSIEDIAREMQQMQRYQQTINCLAEAEINTRFEQWLDDLNLTEEKKEPLRGKTVEEKRKFLAMQYRGSMQVYADLKQLFQFVQISSLEKRLQARNGAHLPAMLTVKGRIYSPEEFVELLNSTEVRGDRRYELITSLRVALTSNTVSWVINFSNRNGLNAILRSLNFSYDNKSERRCILECVKCLRAYTNNRLGLMQIVAHEEALTILSRCIDSRDVPSMLEAVKLLAAICLVPPDGHEKVLEGITVCSELRGCDRFLPIVRGLSVVDLQTACLQLINAIISTPDDLNFRLHLRNEFIRTGLAEAITLLEKTTNDDVKTQLRIFTELRDEDAEEIFHRYENIRFEMDDPKECFDMLFNSTLNTAAEPYFLSILQHLLSIRDDVFARHQYYKLIEECVTQVVLHKDGLDPDFRYTKRFNIDVEPLLGKLSDDNADESSFMSSAPRQFRTKLEEALTAKQEFEAKVSTLEEKVKTYEAEISELKLRITQGVGSALSASLSAGSASNVVTCGNGPLPPPPPGSVPPPPPLTGLGSSVPNAPPLQLSGVPPPPGAPLLSQPVFKLPDYLKPKKKYHPEQQMKRANWTKVNVKDVEKDSFWAVTNEERLARDDIFQGLLTNFSTKVIVKPASKEQVDGKSAKRCKELRVLDPKAGQNLSILLGSIKVPYDEIRRRILEMDESCLTVGLVEQLIRYLPLPDQMKKLEAFRDDYCSLAEPEQFAIVMSSIKRVVPRLTSIAFKMKFGEMLSELKPDVVAVTAGLEEVKQSRKFARVLELVLLMGNYMNAGSRNEQTYGFELSFLPKLVNTKTLDNTRTLMHYLVETAEKHFPEVINLPDELMHVDKAARVSEDSIQKTLTQLKKSIKQSEIDVRNAQQDKNTPPNDRFLPVMTFLSYAKDQCDILEGMQKKMATLYREMAKYYCFDSKKYGIEEFFCDLKTFLDAFVQAKKDIAKEREIAEKSKRVKEAQERRERERQEKVARTNALVNVNNEDDQEGVMDNLLEALKTGTAFNVNRERKEGKKRTPRAAGAERRAQLARSRSRQNILSPDAGGSSAAILREVALNAQPSSPFMERSTPLANRKRTATDYTRSNSDGDSLSSKKQNGFQGNASGRSEAELLLERLRAL